VGCEVCAFGGGVPVFCFPGGGCGGRVWRPRRHTLRTRAVRHTAAVLGSVRRAVRRHSRCDDAWRALHGGPGTRRLLARSHPHPHSHTLSHTLFSHSPGPLCFQGRRPPAVTARQRRPQAPPPSRRRRSHSLLHLRPLLLHPLLRLLRLLLLLWARVSQQTPPHQGGGPTQSGLR
jgi:hypothetical protein